MEHALLHDRQTILIVEDEPFIRFDLVDFFEDAGFAVFEAEDADVAIELMQVEPSIRIVLTDVDMPGSMNGVKLAHYIRERFPPTLLLVASGAVKLEAADLPTGATFFAKPYDPRAVLSLIRATPA